MHEGLLGQSDLIGKEGRGVPWSIFEQQSFVGEVMGGSGERLMATVTPELVEIVDLTNQDYLFKVEIDPHKIWSISIRSRVGDPETGKKHPDFFALKLVAATLKYCERIGNPIETIALHWPGNPKSQLNDNYQAFVKAIGDNVNPSQRAKRAAATQTPSYKMFSQLGYGKIGNVVWNNMPGAGVVAATCSRGDRTLIREGDINLPAGIGKIVRPEIDVARMSPLQPPFSQTVVDLIMENAPLSDCYVKPYMEFALNESEKLAQTHPEGIGFRSVLVSLDQETEFTEDTLDGERVIHVLDYDSLLALGCEQSQEKILLERRREMNPQNDVSAYGQVFKELSRGLRRTLRSQQKRKNDVVPAIVVYDLAKLQQIDNYAHSIKDKVHLNELVLAIYPVFLPQVTAVY